MHALERRGLLDVAIERLPDARRQSMAESAGRWISPHPPGIRGSCSSQFERSRLWANLVAPHAVPLILSDELIWPRYFPNADCGKSSCRNSVARHFVLRLEIVHYVTKSLVIGRARKHWQTSGTLRAAPDEHCGLM